ncbi:MULTISPECIES: SDR family NAD(P)-dependent oxidoreductase [unclassified Streptomyces]|uniref:SDR family NAD(P)-dependent oxidoreductase n=1 Tax=unclassified Streptomyces TaxID=2593676 RepID=UPI002DD8CFB5|nr:MULTISPECIES: SDR family NAD(P)-dependent oxidoreductase [unclassified Streptomyces]WSF90225.1 SDR family NAD(P)-dependent oxidoreductase [Streptomyces sp. NBC_01744]WSC42050.1 SDR family NAD(P)-dependent oxidoreductase [Streptomyces sp. NBC_01763]WSC50394.1 SDR family NAD(P)-dependent oxidoreductase [Streptomyces sp. NBC_01762]WSC59098.1 SDR family NAD(P)-dependent oxidoreductase [Streptomyces sp. NBC_01761]WSD29995.1 SDR family NAD(P)-dependent oxidoreductase [Streptomyces sp. NBC_01751]
MNANGTGNGNGMLEGAVIAVAGAAGPAGRATLLRLAEAGAIVVASDADPTRLAEAVDAARYAHGGATVTGDTVDLLDLAATREWAAKTEKEFGRIDGLVHLVGGWRGSATFAETDLADWDLLEKLLIRTVQHTSLAFHDGLLRSDRGRFLLISAAGASRPTAGNAAYAASKAAAEAWTLALADAFRKAGGDEGPKTAAAILIVKALVHDAMRAERPNAKFAGFTDVKELADAIAGVWERPAPEVNGKRLWLTPQP